ncbi:adenylate/guanylate cyclase domain-containing protein [Paenibacillus sp. y28]|uniref:adenylate/guanylate cyclase domain-containing protein n=1 Tax=Paenibacillus sp. y28 TaxID=3129110 RepID=UPI003018D304
MSRNRTYVMEESVPLPRKRVWELLSHTDHLNRVIGLFPVLFDAAEQGEAGLYRRAAAKAFGLVPMRWKEYPFEWVKHESYAVTRLYEGGPLRSFYGGIRLFDAPPPAEGRQGEVSGTIVRLFAQFESAGLLGRLAVPLIGKASMKNTLAYLTRYLEINPAGFVQETAGTRLVGSALAPAGSEIGLAREEAGAGAEAGFSFQRQAAQEIPLHSASDPLPAIARLPQPRQRDAVNVDELRRLLLKLSEFPLPRRLLPLLGAHLREAGDDEVIDMRPYVLADQWNVSREETLRLFLYATHTGITNLSWHLLCPNCRVSKADTGSLAGIRRLFHCDFCGITYEAGFDKHVELCFSVHPVIRRAVKQTYCVGGPSLSPHIHAQAYLNPGQQVTLYIPDAPGETLRLRVLKQNHTVHVNIGWPESEPGESRGELAASTYGSPPILIRYNGQFRLAEPVQTVPGQALLLENGSAAAAVIALERSEWEDLVVTAAKVTTLPEFRAMFSSEVLAPGEQVGVENVTVLFSDLSGSTSFYEQVGDARAYGQVRRHFAYLAGHIEQHQGSIVKTIGDAVMAVFQKPEQGVMAALDIQRHVASFHDGLPPGERIAIKLGLQNGPAIAVCSNDRLDYFGRTVNLAARNQGQSLGGDMVISQACADQPAVRSVLASYRAEEEHFEAEMKGFSEKMALVRIRPRQVGQAISDPQRGN